MTAGDAIKLSGETREALEKARHHLDTLTSAGVHKPSILGDMIEPTLRIKEHIERDLADLEALIERLGL